VRVHAVLTGPTDTEMTRGLDPDQPRKSGGHTLGSAIDLELDAGDVLADPGEDLAPDPVVLLVGVTW